MYFLSGSSRFLYSRTPELRFSSKGRFIVERVAGQTKKGNIKIDVKKFS